jgi:lysophospholipase L1-like esterase
VSKDFQQFVKIVHQTLPETRIIYIAIKPSISRWDKVDRMREANRAIRKFAEATEGVEFADIDTPMIGEDGRPRPSLFRDDGLHLNEEGYALWTKILRPSIVPDRKPD